MLSIPHMIVVFLVVLVVFGPQKLPELARSFGKLMAEFRKASNEFKNAFEEEMRDLERQARIAELKKQVAEANAAANAALNKPIEPATLATPPPAEPVISPNPDAVPRLDAASNETTPPAPIESTPAPQSGEGSTDGQQAPESSPSHDQQQPA